MIDPVKRLQTFQDLDAQRKADLKQMEEKKQEKARELFKPVVEAFRTMADAGVRRVTNYMKPAEYPVLFSRYGAGEISGSYVSFPASDSYAVPRALRVRIPDAGKVVFDDNPFEYEGPYTGAYCSGAPKSETKKFANHEELLDYALQALKDILVAPPLPAVPATPEPQPAQQPGCWRMLR